MLKYKAFEPITLPIQIIKEMNLTTFVKVKIRPETFADIDSCLNNAKEYLNENDGSLEFGWKIANWGNLLLKLTAHVVVKLPNKKLTCVSPSTINASALMFIPDPEVEKLIVNNRLPVKHFPLIKHHLLDELIEVENKFESIRMGGSFGITPQDANAYDMQRFLLFKKLEAIAIETTKKDDLCFCGSRKARKKCCKFFS